MLWTLAFTVVFAFSKPAPKEPFAISNPQNANNESFKSLSMGHLLSSNNTGLAKKQWSLGTMYAGYGITDRWTVVTSPFVLYDFEMLNFQSRYAWDLKNGGRIGFDVGYFKSLENKNSEYLAYCLSRVPPVPVAECIESTERALGYKNFKMEAWSLKTTYTHLIHKTYRANVTLGYFYYADDTRPFSFRMDPANDDKYSLSLTSLHEFKISKKRFINLEAGFWGLNYQHPYYHAGLSYGYQTRRWLISLGASSTFNPDFPNEKVRKFAYYDSRFSIHPELQIQRFF